MLHIKPIFDKDATDDVLDIYSKIRSQFKLDTTPLFFEYMGNFPDFLSYIWKSVESNLENESFLSLSKECQNKCLNLFSSAYSPSETARNLMDEILKEKGVNNFIRVKIGELSLTNAQMALLFVAMREAIKGWAVTTKLLEDKFESAEYDAVTPRIEREVEASIITESSNLTISARVEQFGYIKFMAVVQSEADDSIKNEAHLHARLQLEEYLVDHIDNVKMDLSYRILADYAFNYKHFDELVYLLSESFPTIGANRVIVSSIAQILLGKDIITSP